MAGPTYYEAFKTVTKKRLSYALNINALLAIAFSFVLSFPYESLKNSVVSIIYRGPILFAAFYLVKLLRDSTSSVSYSSKKTFADQVVASASSKSFLIGAGLYSSSALVVGLVQLFALPFTYNYYQLSKEYQQRPVINDGWVFYWFSLVYTAVVYLLQFYVFQHNRLPYKCGVLKVSPQEVLFHKSSLFFGAALISAGFIAVSAPLVYLIFHSTVYKCLYIPALLLGLDTSTPSYAVSFEVWVSLVYLAFWLVVLWEHINHVYQVYVTIGCLDSLKPISTYCEEPVKALVVAIQDVRPESLLCRLTAFQELAYIATTSEPQAVKLRALVYEHSRNTSLWEEIFEECSLLIREATMRINHRTPREMEKSEKAGEEDTNFLEARTDLFGNSAVSKSVLRHDTNKETSSEPAATPKATILLLPVLAPLKSLLALFQLEEAVKEKEKYVQRWVLTTLDQAEALYRRYTGNFLSTVYGTPFRVTLDRDAQSRVIDPTTVGNAAIAVANLLMHAIEQDKAGTIGNGQVAEVMNLLEMPIRGCSEYSKHPPSSVYQPEGLSRNRHVIAYLHDVFMSEYFQVCLKYNHKLNDLVLTSGAFRLAKLVIDVAIAENELQK